MTDAQRLLIESALVYAGGEFSVADIERAIANGKAQLWEGPNSVVVTELDRFPGKTILHFWLAAGRSEELEAMQDGIIAWGREQGCAKARFVGRKGWERTFMAETGWVNTGLIIMEKAING